MHGGHHVISGNQMNLKIGLSHLISCHFVLGIMDLISCKTVSFSTAQCQGATTKEECEAFAIQLGLSDTTSGDVTNNFQVPSRCYYRPNNPEDKKLWFNTANVTENTSPCTQDRICVCKNGLTPFRDLLDTLRRCWHNSNSFLSKHSS